MTDPPRPVLLTSLASAALLDGRGDLELMRETRGALIDWGGVYAQLVRLTGPWRLSLQSGDATANLPATHLGSEEGSGVWHSHHRWGTIEVEQLVAAIPDPPGVLRTLRVATSETSPVTLVVNSDWSPFLLPVLIEGIRPILFQAEVHGGELRVRQREFGLSFRSNVRPVGLHFNRSSWNGIQFDGPLEVVTSEHRVTVAAGAPAEVTFLIHGGLHRDLEGTSVGEETLRDPRSVLHSIGTEEASWASRTPVLQFPDAPWIDRAYSLARASLRRLYTAPGGGMVGLVAGYPWYSAIWCRDLAWMLPAVIWLGDVDWAERSLASVFRFQSRAELPILGGTRGELPMQISPGPLFLYGTSDTTLYYPGLIDRFVRHSGRTQSVRTWSNVVGEILDWGGARVDPATGLLRHGGEALSIGSVATSVAPVEYGIDAPDTTIWDSTDRRSHAIDVQVLWAEALRAGARLLSTGPGDPTSVRRMEMAQRVEETVRRLYPWPDEGYLFDSLHSDGPVRKLRPNALRAVSAGWFDPALARSFVRRVAQEDLTTEWGVRSLSRRDPTYDPQAYHDGQVWTIATAWAADAAFAAGEVDLGIAYLRTIARRIEEEGGFANECYRGDRPEPFDSCFLLGFSVGPFLTILFERLWGLEVDAPRSRLEVRPQFPTTWTAASLRQLRMGEGWVDLDWTPRRLTVRWSGPAPLTLVTRAGKGSVPSGTRQEFALA